MLKKSSIQQHELEMVTLEELVPQDHLVRKIDQAVDFEFIHDEVAHLYCHDNGRPSIDPVRLFKMMLLGYLFGVKSERQLVKEVQVNVAYRWFLGMTLTEKVMHASTLSQNRIRRFNGTDIFERIFTRIVEQAMAKRLVAGDELFTDSTHLKANANKNKYRNEQRVPRVSAYIDMLDADIAQQREEEGLKPLKPQKPSTKLNNTKVSTTDPDSGFMTRDNKPQGFFYLDHRTVDGKHGIILDTYATPGNVHDAQPYVQRLTHTLTQFNLTPIAAGLDAGYFTASVAQSLQNLGILGVFSYRRPSRTKNTFKKKHFHHDAQTDTYHCPNEHVLVYKTTTRQGYREYHSDPKQCQQCPVRTDCTSSQQMKKVVIRHIYQEAVDQANLVRLSPYGKRTLKRRAQTVERSFADAKQHHGHRYARHRGLARVQIQCWLAATAQNIKKIALVVFLWFYPLWATIRKAVRSPYQGNTEEKNGVSLVI